MSGGAARHDNDEEDPGELLERQRREQVRLREERNDAHTQRGEK